MASLSTWGDFVTPQEIVQTYIQRNYRLVFWPTIGDDKGPRVEGWQNKTYTLEDYQENYRVGIMTGTAVAPESYLHDVDLDWTPGSLIAQYMLAQTNFVIGRSSKQVSHCFYTTEEPIASMRFEDIDKTCLIELRGTKADGTVGLETMVPPSIWSKGSQREQLIFVRNGAPTHLEALILRRQVCLSAIAMILARHLGHHGFGHATRLCWAGFLLRAGVAIEEMEMMGHALSAYCHNTEIHDIKTTLTSTLAALNSKDKEKKVVGGPTLARIIGDKGKQVIARISTWLGKTEDFIRDKDGKIIARNQENIKRAIELLGYELTYNQFSDKLLVNDRPMEDRQIDSISLQIESDFRFQPPDTYFEKVVKNIAWNNGFHPVKDYLNKLVWDNVPRIEEWLIHSAGVEDSLYTRAVSSIMLIAAVRRIRSPGCKYDEMVIWESDQGTGKSSAAAALCPNPTWFSDDLALNVRSQQLIEATLGKWIVEASDLAGKRKAEVEQLKAMLSRQVDGPARMAYARFPVERPRHFIIIGTTNSATYLTDPTAGRRFWPMRVHHFDLDWIRGHRDQLWAEACVREAEGASIRLPEELWPAATEAQEARREIDPWEVIIRSLLLNVQPDRFRRRRVVTSSIWDALGIDVDRRDRYGSLRISDIMQRLGFKRTRLRPPGEEVQVGFIQVEFDRLVEEGGEEIEGEPEVETPF